jgi:uncharacterized membrane protein YgcG
MGASHDIFFLCAEGGIRYSSLHSPMHFIRCRTIWGGVCALLLCLPAWSVQTDVQPQEGTERIRSFDSRITVNSDRGMMVRETIDVEVAGVQIKHGIFREFPTRYQDWLGNRYIVSLEVVTVERDGRPEPYYTAPTADGLRIYFGSSDKTVPAGLHRYVLTYKTDRQLGFFEDHDELYWNVTGTRWAFPIDVATATVVLPPQVHNFVKEMTGYAGSQGERDQQSSGTRDEDGNPTFRADHLLPQQGLTIVITWPKGLIAAPSGREKLKWFLDDNRAAATGLVGLAVVLLYYFVVWVRVGRDPSPGTIVPLYDPPDNMSPAAMRYLKHMGFDEKALTSAILGLAAKGYLTIDQQESRTYRLNRKAGYGKVESGLSFDEKSLVRKLFERGATVHLDPTNHSLIQGAKKALSMALHTSIEGVYFITNARYLWPGLGLTIAALAATLVVAAGQMGSGQIAATVFIMIWLSGWTAGVTLLINSVVRAWRSARATGIAGKAGALFLTLFSVPFLCGEIFGFYMLSRAVSASACLIIAMLIGSNVLFHHLLKAPTRAGRQLLDRIDGFKMFLTAVDTPAPGGSEVFERYLPYAFALGVEHAWAKRFSQALAAAAVSGHGGTSYSPSWYTGDFISASPDAFASSFAGSFSSAVSADSSPPASSSGSGGGGSSGGGGGGGGGGGW